MDFYIIYTMTNWVPNKIQLQLNGEQRKHFYINCDLSRPNLIINKCNAVEGAG